MFDERVMQNVLGTDFDKWFEAQTRVDDKFFNGKLTRREYVVASAELLVEYMPKEGNIKGAHYVDYKELRF